MRSIVTGGAGFIGSHLAERLKQSGDEVLVIDSLSAGDSRFGVLRAAGIDMEVIDIRQEKLVRTIQDFRPGVIFHLAAQAAVALSVKDPILDAKVNVVGLLRVLEAARSSGARIVFASSGGTIYGEADPPVGEDTLGSRPGSPYGITKRVAEDYLRFYQSHNGVQFVSLALANVYGPRQDPYGEAGVVAIFAARLLAGKDCVIYGDGKQTRDFVYVSDVVDAFMAAAGSGEGETINIGTGKESSINEIYQTMAGICGVESPPRYKPERPGDLRRSALAVSKAKEMLGWERRVSLEEGLRMTIDSFRS